MLYIIDESAELQATLRKALYRHRIFCLGVTLSSLSSLVEQDERAILVWLRPHLYGEGEQQALLTLAKSHNCPLISLSESGLDHIHQALIESLVALEETRDIRYVSLRCKGLSDDLRDSHTRFFSLPMPLTPTERMILRYMLYVAPRGATTEELMTFGLAPDNACVKANIPTHIRKINQYFKPSLGGRLITYKAGAYRLMEDLPTLHI